MEWDSSITAGDKQIQQTRAIPGHNTQMLMVSLQKKVLRDHH